MKIRTNKRDRKAVNLYLSEEAIKKAERLQKALCRPSISNVVEALISDAAGKRKQVA